jgi:hypothetical protein
MKTQTIKLADIKASVKTQARAEINKDVLADYTATAKEAKAKGASSPFPPLIIFKDMGGTLWLGDGFTRRQACVKAEIDEHECEVLEGEQKDALAFAFKANQTHGARLTNADKQHNLKMALADEEWAKLDNVALAELLGVSEGFVRSNRPAAKAPKERVGKDGKKRNATRTKKADKPPKPEKPAKGAKADKKGAAGDDKTKPPKEDKALTAAIEKIAKAIHGKGYDAEAFKASVADGSLELSPVKIKEWAQTNEARILTAAPLIIGKRWTPAKAFAFLDKVPDKDTKADHFMDSATAHGGLLQEKVGDFKFIVFDAARYVVGEAKDGTITLTPKKK